MTKNLSRPLSTLVELIILGPVESNHLLKYFSNAIIGTDQRSANDVSAGGGENE